MGTRSTIALEFADGTVQQVYCHWDGYLEHNGKILQEHYSDPFKLRDLIDLGDMSSLGEHALVPSTPLKKHPKASVPSTVAIAMKAAVKLASSKTIWTMQRTTSTRNTNTSCGPAGDKAVWFVSDHGKDFVP
jgi:hypothetical protein